MYINNWDDNVFTYWNSYSRSVADQRMKEYLTSAWPSKHEYGMWVNNDGKQPTVAV